MSIGKYKLLFYMKLFQSRGYFEQILL